jgi:hypothetical protein
VARDGRAINLASQDVVRGGRGDATGQAALVLEPDELSDVDDVEAEVPPEASGELVADDDVDVVDEFVDELVEDPPRLSVL